MKIAPAFLAIALIALVAGRPAFAQEKNETVAIEIPASAKATLTREAAGNPILDLARGDDNGSPTFTATVKIEGTEYNVTVDAKGKLLGIDLKNPPEQPEPKLENFPANAQAALAKFGHGAKVERAESDRSDVSYSVVVKEESGLYRITVDAGGKLVRKQPVDE